MAQGKGLAGQQQGGGEVSLALHFESLDDLVRVLAIRPCMWHACIIHATLLQAGMSLMLISAS